MIPIKKLHELSKSQLGQDLWVLKRLNFPEGGFFVEAGAADGEHLSNTWLLEKHLKWNGICCEPNPVLCESVRKSRNCIVDDRVLYGTSGELIELSMAGELGGTAEDFEAESISANRHKRRTDAPITECTTVTLDDLLNGHQAPQDIDYISLDTEGSELRILEAFSFEWNVKIWSVEHNSMHRADGVEYRDAITRLMATHGYTCELNRWDMYFYR